MYPTILLTIIFFISFYQDTYFLTNFKIQNFTYYIIQPVLKVKSTFFASSGFKNLF